MGTDQEQSGRQFRDDGKLGPNYSNEMVIELLVGRYSAIIDG